MTPLGGALAARARGWHVFPVGGSNGPKAPRPGWLWADRNTTDAATVRRWLDGASAYGIACGPSRLVVIDLDMAKDGSGSTGRAAFTRLCAQAGEQWPVTYTVATPSGGLHLYFRASREHKITNSAGGLPPLADVRGAGGYVVGSGSVIPGGEYQVRGSVRALASLPEWLARLLAPPPPRLPSPPGCPGPGAAVLAAWLARQPEGNRNEGLFWAACRAAEAGSDPWGLVPVAVQAGLSERGARATVASAARRYQPRADGGRP
jgi:hypothetical protein